MLIKADIYLNCDGAAVTARMLSDHFFGETRKHVKVNEGAAGNSRGHDQGGIFGGSSIFSGRD